MALHQVGFIHRDIKPANISIGNTQDTAGNIYLIDLGMCKKYFNADSVNSEIPLNNFRGTVRYASLRTHYGFDLCRGDDLISLIYVLIELYIGDLPWSHLTQKEEVQRMKEKYMGKSLMSEMPKQFEQIWEYLSSVDFFDQPDYILIAKLMRDAAVENEIDLKAPFDWEEQMDLMRITVKKQFKIDSQMQNQEQGEFSAINQNTDFCIIEQVSALFLREDQKPDESFASDWKLIVKLITFFISFIIA
ncbi:MAG: hypothetical protein EZS28_012446 [Streblomastix strix]|uniref:Protein kinase domain-containing protein n=1 Tax=Streblomastix strix TaxID=222440 RepID=A0A5J4WBT3_9EUKA|nr:MAG: hypothetical protein EZS28_012446 [Streblomastix strix]